MAAIVPLPRFVGEHDDDSITEKDVILTISPTVGQVNQEEQQNSRHGKEEELHRHSGRSKGLLQRRDVGEEATRQSSEHQYCRLHWTTDQMQDERTWPASKR